MVKNFQMLLADEKYDEAADMVLDAIATVINFNVPTFVISREELKKVGPALLAKLQGPSDEEGEEEAEPTLTDAPGDDIVIAPTTGKLTVKFTGPEGDLEFPNIPDRNIVYAIGQIYSFMAPDLAGYTVTPAKVVGTMTADGVVAEFVYTAVDAEAEEEETGSGSTGSGSTESGGSSSGGTAEAGAGEGGASGDGAELGG